MNAAIKIKKLRDEIQALKAVQPINGGALTRHSATATWQGLIDKNSPLVPYLLLAGFKVVFVRKDGVKKPPLAQIAYTLEPNMDIAHFNTLTYYSITNVSDGTVEYEIYLGDTWWPFDKTQTTGFLKIAVYVYSPVEGSLSIERIS